MTTAIHVVQAKQQPANPPPSVRSGKKPPPPACPEAAKMRSGWGFAETVAGHVGKGELTPGLRRRSYQEGDDRPARPGKPME